MDSVVTSIRKTKHTAVCSMMISADAFRLSADNTCVLCCFVGVGGMHSSLDVKLILKMSVLKYKKAEDIERILEIKAPPCGFYSFCKYPKE